jgi:hypothetical protein
MRRPKRRFARVAGIVVAVLLIILVVAGYYAYTKRQAILEHEIAKAKETARLKYNLDLEIGSAEFTGLSTIALSNVTIVPDHRDSLLSIKDFEVNVKLAPLILGEVKLADVVIKDAHLNLTDINHIKNFDFLFNRRRDTTENTKADLSDLSYRLVNEVLYKIPDDLDVNNFMISVTTDSSSFRMLTKTAAIQDGQLTSTIDINNGAATWHFAGRMHPSDKDIDIKLYADGRKVELPYIEKRYHAKVSFDTISTRLTRVDHEDGQTHLSGYWGVSNLVVNQARLASNDIVIPNASIQADVSVGQNYVALDSTSTITLKNATAHPFIKYTLSPSKIYELKLHTGWVNAQDLFSSFPPGVFDALDGIQVSGRLNYSLNLFLNTADPDGVQFDSRLDKDNFHIIHQGKTDLGKLNSTFVYTPYEFGKPMPSRVIGPQNPDFTPLDQISTNLQNAVMTAEDPTFYTNHGFVEESIRKSIATDYKEHKFKRGGSTISMQLVKNTFLSREKTLLRKVEEILIVWMIENNDIMTKARMLEVYFNIIEWGNNVYGIGEASRYYFNKTPGDLTIGESIYLASIVPHPKTGLYSFQPDGTLRPGLVWYFNLIGNLMAGHGKAQRDSSNYGFYSVRLKESLRKEAPSDTVAADRLIRRDREENDDDDAQPVVTPPPGSSRPASSSQAAPQQAEKKPGFFQRLFGKKDTTVQKGQSKNLSPREKLDAEIQKLRDEEKQQEDMIDTAGKTRKEIRQEKRKLRSDERDQEKALKQQAGQ